MTKHTPAPWEATRDCPSGQLHVRTVDPDGAWICGQIDNGTDMPKAEAEANARVIAAAPVMLDFIKTVAAGNTEIARLEELASQIINQIKGDA